MYDDMCDLSRGHCKLSGTYNFWETWAFEYFPYTRPELIHTDLGLGLVPLAWRWYRSNLRTVRRKESLRDLRAFFYTCSLEQNMRAGKQMTLTATHTEGSYRIGQSDDGADSRDVARTNFVLDFEDL
ncbi:hypothetical protein JCGZ_05175 [Jatropha curcas]|uniref:Aminotransferase-like plant mobile domain-containing protein n=1 Tax=Jatropha curcas TaxID=180498 RepID=A0A067L2I3_JATCU|nr:hypothetical protein JCGZ_05175 [Jatropha curcas]